MTALVRAGPIPEAARPAPRPATPGVGAAALPTGLWLTGLLTLLALFLATRPHLGVTHDAMLYLAQALHRLEPERFSTDLFFASGSQDRFTLFSALYAPLVQALGPGGGHEVMLLTGHALWLGGLLVLMTALFGRGRAALAAAAAAIAMSSTYGGYGVFRYAEPFATPRLFAEAGVMLALAFSLRERWWGAGAALAGALVLHPLMTLPGIAVVAVMAARARPRLWLLLPLGAGMLLVPALGGIDPFARIFVTYDPAWWGIVRDRAKEVFIARWTMHDAARLLCTAAFIGMGWALATVEQRRLLGATMLVAAAGLVATLLGGDLLRNVLVVNLQPWRALWLLTLLGNAFAAWALVQAPRGGAAWPLLAAAMLCHAAEAWLRFPGLLSTPLALLAWAALMLRHRIDGPRVRLVAVIVASAALVLMALPMLVLTPLKMQLEGAAPVLAALAVLLAAPVLLLALRPGRAAAPLLATGALLAAVAAGAVDRRAAWDRFAADPAVPEDLRAFLDGAGTLYWDGGLALQWFKLRQPSAYSCSQGAGVIFFRGTALEYHRRTEALAGLNSGDFSPIPGLNCRIRQNPAEDGPRHADQLVAACRAMPDLDTIVLPHLIPGAPHTAWRPPVPFRRLLPASTPTLHDMLYRYDCAGLRGAS